DDPPVRTLQQRRLREHVRAILLGQAPQHATDDLLRVAEAVRRGRIYPIDPVLERAVDRVDRLLVILGPPTELPSTAPDLPCPEPDPSDLKPRRSQLPGCQLRLLHRHRSFAHARGGHLGFNAASISKRYASFRYPRSGRVG